MLTAIDKPVKGGEKKLRRTQEERRAKARADLIDSAINLVVHNGFARTTMADIAKRAGLTRGALQHHFTGRAELVAAIIADVEKQIVDSFGAASSADASIEARLDLLIDGLSEVSLSAGYMAAMDIWLTSRSDPDLCQLIDDSVARSSVMYPGAMAHDFWRQPAAHSRARVPAGDGGGHARRHHVQAHRGRSSAAFQ